MFKSFCDLSGVENVCNVTNHFNKVTFVQIELQKLFFIIKPFQDFKPVNCLILEPTAPSV